MATKNKKKSPSRKVTRKSVAKLTQSDALISKVNKIKRTCEDHGSDLVNAAKTTLKTNKLPNIAYHLATLALEEVGKSEILAIGHLATKKTESLEWALKQSEDHRKKLFWAFWGPSFGKEIITGEKIDSLHKLTRTIHDTRLMALYVETDTELPVPPKKAVTRKQALNMIRLAEARIGISKSGSFSKTSKKERDNLQWFSGAAENPEMRKLIFGRKSMERLVELKQSKKWIAWMREQFEEAEAKGKKALEKEMKRAIPNENEALKQKWKIKLRLHCGSHSIRPKSFNYWNRSCNWIKLHHIGGTKKQQLRVEITLPKAVPLNGLWWQGWGTAKAVVAALNIGSMGFFWWELPSQISRYYESISDLDDEDGGSVVVERTPQLTIDWGRTALDDADLRNAALCFSMMPKPQDRSLHVPYDHYLTGLGFLAKTDIHLQFEANAYHHFYQALKNAMLIYGDWDGHEPYEIAFHRVMDELITGLKGDDQYLDIGKALEGGANPANKITLTEVGTMKIICDAYLLKSFNRLADERVKEEERAKVKKTSPKKKSGGTVKRHSRRQNSKKK